MQLYIQCHHHLQLHPDASAEGDTIACVSICVGHRLLLHKPFSICTIVVMEATWLVVFYLQTQAQTLHFHKWWYHPLQLALVQMLHMYSNKLHYVVVVVFLADTYTVCMSTITITHRGGGNERLVQCEETRMPAECLACTVKCTYCKSTDAFVW